MKNLTNTPILVRIAILACVATITGISHSCSDDIPAPAPEPNTNNNAIFIKEKEKLATIYSIEDIDGSGRLYEVRYTADYKLDDALSANMSTTMDLFKFVQQKLFDSIPTNNSSNMSFTPGCSAFATTNPSNGNFLMGRNYDFCHKAIINGIEQYIPISAFVVHTAPINGKKSISFVDGYNFGFTQGAYTDNTTDLSMLIGLPYAALDGINEDGFAIGVLSLNEAPTTQNDPTKTNINTTVAIRLLLDKASSVNHAIELLKQYNMRMKNLDDKHNYHFFMADAHGDYAIVEYTRNTSNPNEKFPTQMEVFKGNDTLRCVTNFYISPSMVGTTDGWGSDHGKTRYFDMRTTLLNHNYKLDSYDAMSLLSLVSQEPNVTDPTSFTQWSALYNLSEKSVRLAILREYGKTHDFKIE